MEAQNNVCCICFEKTRDRLKCGHCTCEDCLKKWEKYNSCPVCRAKLDESKPAIKFNNYDEDVDGDEDFAARLQLNEYEEEKTLAPTALELFSFLAEQRPCTCRYCTEPLLIACATCEYTLHLNDNTLSCRKCNKLFYCSEECREQHEQECEGNYIAL